MFVLLLCGEMERSLTRCQTLKFLTLFSSGKKKIDIHRNPLDNYIYHLRVLLWKLAVELSEMTICRGPEWARRARFQSHGPYVAQTIPFLSWSYNVTLILDNSMDRRTPRKHRRRKIVLSNVDLFFSLAQSKLYPITLVLLCHWCWITSLAPSMSRSVKEGNTELLPPTI